MDLEYRRQWDTYVKGKGWSFGIHLHSVDHVSMCVAYYTCVCLCIHVYMYHSLSFIIGGF